MKEETVDSCDQISNATERKSLQPSCIRIVFSSSSSLLPSGLVSAFTSCPCKHTSCLEPETSRASAGAPVAQPSHHPLVHHSSLHLSLRFALPSHSPLPVGADETSSSFTFSQLVFSQLDSIFTTHTQDGSSASYRQQTTSTGIQQSRQQGHKRQKPPSCGECLSVLFLDEVGRG